MLKIENTVVFGWEAAIRGMRNPMNSWEKSDSHKCLCKENAASDCEMVEHGHNPANACNDGEYGFCVGENDLALMQRLARSGPDHGKFLRMVNVTADITAPLYWWKEYDTYKVGTVANSCSTMHKIAAKPFSISDFSCQRLHAEYLEGMRETIRLLNRARDMYLSLLTQKKPLVEPKAYWWQMIQLLPSSYNQRRTVQLNYEVLRKMYFARKDHKLDEWHTLCDWMLALPYFREICCGEGGKD